MDGFKERVRTCIVSLGNGNVWCGFMILKLGEWSGFFSFKVKVTSRFY